MQKQGFFVISCVLIACLGLSGCITNTNQVLNEHVDLSNVALSKSDFNETFEEYDITHKTEPYTVDEGLIFTGWTILEKYESRFAVDEVTFLIQQLAKHPSTENASMLIDELKTQDIGYDFSLYAEEDIGDKSFIGTNTSTIFGSVNTLYLITFQIENINVVLVSSNISYDVMLSKARLIENQIHQEIKNNN